MTQRLVIAFAFFLALAVSAKAQAPNYVPPPTGAYVCLTSPCTTASDWSALLSTEGSGQAATSVPPAEGIYICVTSPCTAAADWQAWNGTSGGGGGSTALQTNGASNSSQTLLNMETSTTNAVGLTVTPSNPSGGIEKWEITGGSYTGNAATATNMASNGSANQVWGMNAGGSAQGWQNSGGGGGMVYPGAGVPDSTGTAWGSSYAVGTGANDLVQLNASAQLPGVSGVNLTGMTLAQIAAGAAGTGIYDFSAATNFKLPVAAGYTATASGECGHDSTNHNFHCYDNSVDNFIAIFPSATPPTSGHIAGFLSTGGAWTLEDLGALPTSVANLAGGVANDIPYQTAANTTAFIAPVNNAVLITSASGVPSEATTLPAGVALGSALTLNNSGSGAASGSTYNGSTAVTASYNTIGASPLAGSASLVTVGTIATGVWQGTAVAAGYGGTGISTAASTGIPQIASGTWTVSNTLPSAVALGNNLTLNNSNSGAASGSTFNGSAAVTLSANTLGAASLANANTLSALNTFSNSPGTASGAYGTLFSGTPGTSSLFNPVVYISPTGATNRSWSGGSPLLAINAPSGYSASASIFEVDANGVLGVYMTAGGTIVAASNISITQTGKLVEISGFANINSPSAGLMNVGTGASAGAGGSMAMTNVNLGASGTLGTAVFGNATSGTVTVEPQTGALGTQTILWPAASGTVALSIASAQGTPTFTAGTSVTSCGCAAGTTCTNQRGELAIVGGTATTGTICTVNFSATLGTAPGYGEVTQNGGATLFGVGHGAPATTGMTISAGISVAASTLTVDYQLLP